ncbi:MAG: phage replisome organizer N-terminal domain-containing protein, partial [Clostridia bacterium]|nr:phage replisome organizer N-terminal domain-containing protein [Clostridia bacterium]
MDKSDKCMYWYKLRKDFFKQSKIMVLRKKYNVNVLLFYLNLMCESIATLGVLCDEDGGAYSAEMLAIMAQTTVNWVEKSLPVLQELKLITVQPNGTIIVNEVQDNLGETSTSRVQKYRAKRANYDMHNSAQGNSDVTFQKRTDIEIETEIDTELDTDGEGDIDSRQSVSDGFVNSPAPIVDGDSRAVS